MCLSILFWGCMSSPPKRYYQINLGEKHAGSLATINKSILVESAVVDDLYDDYRIIYRISPFELNYYSYEFWADKPGNLIANTISHFLVKNQVLAKVTRDLLKGIPDIILKSKIYVIEEVDKNEVWFGRLFMDLEFVDFKTGKSLLFHSFDRTEKLSAKRLSELPIVISRILEEELIKILKELPAALK